MGSTTDLKLGELNDEDRAFAVSVRTMARKLKQHFDDELDASRVMLTAWNAAKANGTKLSQNGVAKHYGISNGSMTKLLFAAEQDEATIAKFREEFPTRGIYGVYDELKKAAKAAVETLPTDEGETPVSEEPTVSDGNDEPVVETVIAGPFDPEAFAQRMLDEARDLGATDEGIKLVIEAFSGLFDADLVIADEEAELAPVLSLAV